MNSLKAPSLQSLMDSDRASNDSQYTDYNIQLDLEEVNKSLTITNWGLSGIVFIAVTCVVVKIKTKPPFSFLFKFFSLLNVICL